MSFFTILTLFLAIFDPVQDCGCFGDAVKLTNWQTFFKNLFFWPFALFLFLQRNRTAPVARGAAEWPVFIFFALVIPSVSVYSYRHLPLLDFRGYKIGNNIAALLEEARLNPEFIFTTELIYNREGEEKVFLSIRVQEQRPQVSVIKYPIFRYGTSRGTPLPIPSWQLRPLL